MPTYTQVRHCAGSALAGSCCAPSLLTAVLQLFLCLPAHPTQPLLELRAGEETLSYGFRVGGTKQMP